MPTPTKEHLSHTMVAQNVTIVARCLARVSPPSPSLSARKRSSNQTPTASPAPTGPTPANPYSRVTDLANTRSTVPSPQELARAERAEEEKARQKKENAAAARAAAALARRRKALRSGRGSRMPSASASVTPATMIPPIQRAVARERARSAEAAAATRHQAEEVALDTVELEDGMLPVSRSLKRTRSSGLGNVTPGGAAAVSIASPLRTVSTAEDDKEAAAAAAAPKLSPGSEAGTNGDDTAPRKRSRLAESLPVRAPSTRRGASTSPVGSTTSLPDTTTRKADASLSPVEPTSAGMRRVVSANDRTAMRATRGGSAAPRNASVGPESVRERSRRDTQPPSHMRDFTS